MQRMSGLARSCILAINPYFSGYWDDVAASDFGNQWLTIPHDTLVLC
jgi:hypothetical protein